MKNIANGAPAFGTVEARSIQNLPCRRPALPSGRSRCHRSAGNGLDAFQFQFESVQRQVDVANERDKRREQRGHARDEYQADEESCSQCSNAVTNSVMMSGRRQQRAERGQDDAQADHPGTAVRMSTCASACARSSSVRCDSSAFSSRAPVNGASQPVGHRPTAAGHAGNKNHRPDGHLQHRNNFIERSRRHKFSQKRSLAEIRA